MTVREGTPWALPGANEGDRIELYGEELDALCHQGAEQPGQGGQRENTQAEHY